FGTSASSSEPTIPFCDLWETTNAKKKWKAIAREKTQFPDLGAHTRVNHEGLTVEEETIRSKEAKSGNRKNPRHQKKEENARITQWWLRIEAAIQLPKRY
ncbi:hypothetical protein LINPERHAP1_LOCUS17312, partial [Linum perenne]